VTVFGPPFENTRGKGASVSLSAEGDALAPPPERAQAGSAAVAALYPAPAGAEAAAAASSRYALAAVCDRVCAELAQAVRAALREGGAGAGAGARPMFEAEGDAEAELVAASASAWPRVRLLPARGHALPRVWEYGLHVEVSADSGAAASV
jgi:hypothetical protein